MKSLLIIFGLILTCCTTKSNAQLIKHVEKDKTKHFVVGVAISTISYEFMYRKTNHKVQSMFFGIGMGMLAGFAKEVYDSTGRGNRDFKDFLWTSTGAVSSSFSLVIHL